MNIPLNVFLRQPWLALLLAGLMALCATSARAVTGCSAGSQTWNIPPITVTPEATGGSAVLYESENYTFSSLCTNSNAFGSDNLYAKLILHEVRSVTDQLKRYGLGMNLVLKSPIGGWQAYDIGAVNDFSTFTYFEPGTQGYVNYEFRLQLVRNSAFTGAVKVLFPAKTPLLSLGLVRDGSSDLIGPSSGLNTPAFAVTVIPKCFGKVDIVQPPSFGHVYTFESQVQKQVSFTITASRNAGCLAQGDHDSYGSFTLNSTFTPKSGAILADGNQALALTDSGGAPNGLKLSILDQDGGGAVTFGTPVRFGELMQNGDTAVLRKNYTARLARTGDPLVTGPFSADVVVTVTYN